MNDDDNAKRVKMAVSALELLNKAHASFMSRVDGYHPAPQAGVLSVVKGELRVSCFGRDLVCHRRPVAVNGMPRSMEYAFEDVDDDDKAVRLLTLYAGPNDLIHRDVERTTNADQISNPYFGSNLLNELAVALLKSPSFGPRPLDLRLS